MIRFLRFFYRGPGLILVLVGIVIGVAGIISNGQRKAKASAEKTSSAARPVGQAKPTASIDPLKAGAAVDLEKRELYPLNKDPVQSAPVKYASSQIVSSKQTALPQLVGFYSQVAAPTPVPVSNGPAPESPWLPASSFIPCVLVNTVDSSRINTPVVGEVTQNCYQNEKLIVPAGTVVSCFAQSGAVRDRIEVAGTWLFVFADGRQLKASGIACVRKADPSSQQFGQEDGSAGIQGTVIISDHWAPAKSFVKLLMEACFQAGATAVNGVVSKGDGGVLVLPNMSPAIERQLDTLLDGEQGDGRFVRVTTGTEFYIFPTETIIPSRRTSELSSVVNEQPPEPKTPTEAAVQMEREIYKASQPKDPDENRPRFRY